MFKKKPSTSKIDEAVAQSVDFELTVADMAHRSERRAWWVAGSAVLTSLVLLAGYFYVLPLKEKVPYLVIADAYTGTSTAARLTDDATLQRVTTSEAINRSNVAHFVLAREAYDLALTNLRDWTTVLTMSSSQVAGGYTNLYSSQNPANPYKLYGKDRAIRVRILSITLIGGDVPKGATVRFQRNVYDKQSGATQPLDSKIVTMTVSDAEETQPAQSPSLGMAPGMGMGMPGGGEQGVTPNNAYRAKPLAPVSNAQPLIHANVLMLRGTYIRCVLETHIVSDIPGFTSCVVTEPVYSVNGKRLLLPKGSKVLGKYDTEPILASSVSYMAGYNMRLLPIIQSMAQLDATYGKEVARTLITNHALQIIYAPREQQDANDYSDMLGYTTVRKQNVTRGRETSRSESEERRALMLPQELKAMGTDTEIFLYEGIPHPVKCDKIRYYQDRYFTRRLMDKVPIPTLSL